jgi:hypothetical protein
MPGASPADVESDACEALPHAEKRFAPSGEGTVLVPDLADGGLKAETVEDLRVLTVDLRKVNVALLEPVEGFAADYAFRRHPALARASRSARVRRNAAASAAARRRNRKVQTA